MDEPGMVKRMAEQVRDRTQEYLLGNEDVSSIVKVRPGDVTRKIDMIAEEALDKAVLAEGIRARIVSEEIGERIVPSGVVPEYTLLYDPVDGSNNLISGIPYYCTSLALTKKGENAVFSDIVAAAVSGPFTGTFSAAKGKGAYLNDAPISSRFTGRKPAYAIYSYGHTRTPPGLIRMQEKDCIVRTMGSIALDICMVARGSYTALVDSRDKISAYDCMGAAFILQEAGGEIRLLDGSDLENTALSTRGMSIVCTGVNESCEAVIHQIKS